MLMRPGQRLRRTIHLGPGAGVNGHGDVRAFQYWDSPSQAWVTANGCRPVWVGTADAAADLPLQARADADCGRHGVHHDGSFDDAPRERPGRPARRPVVNPPSGALAATGQTTSLSLYGLVLLVVSGGLRVAVVRRRRRTRRRAPTSIRRTSLADGPREEAGELATLGFGEALEHGASARAASPASRSAVRLPSGVSTTTLHRRSSGWRWRSINPASSSWSRIETRSLGRDRRCR